MLNRTETLKEKKNQDRRGIIKNNLMRFKVNTSNFHNKNGYQIGI